MNDENAGKNNSDLPGDDGVWQKLPLLSSPDCGNSGEVEKGPKYTEIMVIMVWLRAIPGFLQPQESPGLRSSQT